jgi:hypothetical protein
MANEDEILVKDLDGTFKILKGGRFFDIAEKPQSPALRPIAPVKTVIVPAFSEPKKPDIADKILANSGMEIPPELRDRAKSIINSYARGIRDAIETKDALRREISRGGLGLREEDVVKLFEAIGTYEQVPKETKVQFSFFTLPKIAPVPPKKEPLQSIIKTAAPPSKLPVIAETKLPAPIPVPPPPTVKPVRAHKIEIKKEVAAPSRPAIISKPSKGVEIPGKVKMMDVRPPSRSVRPAEELRMSLQDFRRLGETPEEAAHTVSDKIERLRKESFAEKLEGIKSWRGSEVYALYSSIIEESVAKRQSFDAVILKRTNEGRPTLTNDEFIAVIGLNKKLRF